MAWTMRFFADYIGKRYPQAVETAEAMTQGRGAALNGLDPRWMWGLHRSLDQANLAALDKRLLTVMAASSYDPADPSFTIDDGRGSAQALLAGRLLAEGDRAGALAMMAGLTSVSAITEVLFNPDLRTASQPAPNLRAAAEADLRRSRDLKNRYPDSLRLIIAEANTLRQLGRPSDAIVVLEAARGRINSKRPFADQGETLPWWWNELGYANSMAGNYEGMTASFASGSAVSESGMPNVSQVINLGSQQIAFARYDDALRTVSAEFLKREMSPYGKMQALSVRGCALALSGEANEAQALLREVTAHESDDPATVTDLRLCLGDDVGAAASLVRRLSHAALRANALKELAHYADPIAGQPSDPRQVRRAKVAQRAEVQQALAAAGGVVDIPLQRNALGW
ncbi:hypothetical protein [Sphingomonas aerophila]|uniref:Uncharacterized protein n=1 Tax=Sphingomonas aerophila TaxID=1344948 RepID=A0A7W9EVS8_9SPHN|nr:hypothetical protein [Sphingomonas aerophila]MBB5716556.1 hypothetical protein [Sphingomonas aerophila]